MNYLIICGTKTKQNETNLLHRSKHTKMKNLLKIAITELEHARVFISSREKMNKTGIKLYDEVVMELKEACRKEQEIEDLIAELNNKEEINHGDEKNTHTGNEALLRKLDQFRKEQH